MKRWLVGSLIGGVAVLACVGVVWRRVRHAPLPSLPAAFAGVMPQRVLWAWEEPEDLRALSPGVGVAYLAETLLVGERVGVMPRRQPLRPAAGAAVMAVVRIETRAGFVDSPEMREEVAARLADFGVREDVRALQVDFDATASQRAFYAGVLRLLRPRMRVGMPLSMTALVSWCGRGSWLRGLPVDEAVPMFFRMGGARAASMGGVREYRVVEPLCRGSVGVSTDEAWPSGFAGMDGAARVYIFAPKPWQEAQLAAVSRAPDGMLREELVR